MMTPTKWITQMNAIGIVSKAGRYGGTYAHSDIAMSFATWISPYRRLKSDENSRLSLNWNLNREISKLNYRIHTDAIKENLISPELTPAQIACTYANEADMLNVVLFGKTAKQWKDLLLKEINGLTKRNAVDVFERLDKALIQKVIKKTNVMEYILVHGKDREILEFIQSKR